MDATILVTVPALAEQGMRRLHESGARLRFLSSEGGQQELGAVLRTEPVDAVVLRTCNLSGNEIRSCPTLKVISRHGAGYNGVDVDAATALGIPVFFAPAANSQSVAELTLGLLLSVARAIPEHTAIIRDGGWNRSAVGLEIAGRTLGILGLGAIGGRLAKAVQGLGMNVIAFDNYAAPQSPDRQVEMVSSLGELLRRSDVLSIHCPLTADTKGMIGSQELAALPKGAIVLNAARGGILDEMALIEQIESGHLAGAGLDALSEEPLPQDHPLRRQRNVVLTPHVGGSTVEAGNSVASIAVDSAVRFLSGKPIDAKLCVNPAVLENRSASV